MSTTASYERKRPSLRALSAQETSDWRMRREEQAPSWGLFGTVRPLSAFGVLRIAGHKTVKPHGSLAFIHDHDHEQDP